MIVGGKPYQSIWPDPSNPEVIKIINQNLLPVEFRIDEIRSSEEALKAIESMKVRGAPLIGICGAFGVYMACLEAGKKQEGMDCVRKRAELLASARPTAVNLARAVDRPFMPLSPQLTGSPLVKVLNNAGEYAVLGIRDEERWDKAHAEQEEQRQQIQDVIDEWQNNEEDEE